MADEIGGIDAAECAKWGREQQLAAIDAGLAADLAARGPTAPKPYRPVSAPRASAEHKQDVTEDALALSFCEAQPNLRYIAKWAKWMTWDGSRWAEDDTLRVFDMVRQHVRRRAGDNKQMGRAAAIAAIERLAKADRRFAATSDQWDEDDWFLNTPAGVADLRIGSLLQHDPERYLTKVTSVAPGGACPTWDQFLMDVTGCDSDYVAFMRRVVGYCLTGSTREHALFFLYGTGGNGKGTFLNTVQRILGDYAVVSPIETFTESANERHPTDLAMLRGARLALAQEVDEGRAWAEAKIKSLTGGDPVTARFMRQDFFTFTPKFKLLIAGNHKPSLRNVDEAIRRRLHLLPFTRCFSADRRDADLGEKLMGEAGGILQWAINGCLDYQAQGLNPPQVVATATAEYFAAENVFEQWLDDCCDRGPELWDLSGKLFQSWKRHAEQANQRAGNQNTFAERMDAAGFVAGNSRGRGGRHWIGLQVRQSEPDAGGWHG